jgi:hypothetical protein
VVDVPPLVQDVTTEVPAPFSLTGWIDDHRAALAGGASLPLFEGHPDGEFGIRIVGGPLREADAASPNEIALYQLEGDATVSVEGAAPTPLKAGSCCVVGSGKAFVVERAAGSVGMVITNDPKGNK